MAEDFKGKIQAEGKSYDTGKVPQVLEKLIERISIDKIILGGMGQTGQKDI